jgi:central glycolytic genes regulator
MREILDIQKRLMPDMVEELKKRYTILQHIMVTGIVGRRTLAGSLGMTERVLRAEVDFLKAQGLLDVENFGMRVSDSGKQLLEDMEPLVKDLFGLTDLEERLQKRFGLKHVIVVPGDSDTSAFTKKELGRAGSMALRKLVAKDDVIAVTGGSTMAEIANWLTASGQLKGNWFVPARGGLGESVELQANTIASTMAKRTGGQYRLLHVPDHLSEEAYQSLIQEPNIQEIMQVIRQARIVVHGIGNAMTMAKRRKVEEETIVGLQQQGALAEAFGYYFDQHGTVVHKMPTVGLRLEDIQRTEVVIAVAGGKSKGRAIAAVMKFGHEDVLVTDEAAAEELFKEFAGESL